MGTEVGVRHGGHGREVGSSLCDQPLHPETDTVTRYAVSEVR